LESLKLQPPTAVLPCRALIAGDHLNADAITAAMIVSSEQGTPARLFFIVHFFPCIFLIVVSPLPLLVARRRPSWPFLIATPSRRCRLCCASIVSFAPPPIRRCPIVSPSAVISRRHCPLRTRRRRPSCVDFHHTGVHQNAAVALLGLFQEGTANDELIVGLDSLSIGEADENSMEDPLADGDETDGNATDGDAADGDMEDGEATMNGLW
jgi:hypothetical protein